MSAEVASEIWGELKRYVNVVDRIDAAESIVSILIDHDHDVVCQHQTTMGGGGCPENTQKMRLLGGPAQKLAIFSNGP